MFGSAEVVDACRAVVRFMDGFKASTRVDAWEVSTGFCLF